MVHTFRKANRRVCNPAIKNNPPTASLKAPIQAKKAGNRAKMPPYSATSSGNQNATSNRPRLRSAGLHGMPNLGAPQQAAEDAGKCEQQVLPPIGHEHRRGHGFKCLHKNLIFQRFSKPNRGPVSNVDLSHPGKGSNPVWLVSDYLKD